MMMMMMMIPTTPSSSVQSSSSSSSTSTTNTTKMEDNNSFCRRDANCTCKICEASITATLDLRSSTKISSSKRSPPETPKSITPQLLNPTVRNDLPFKLKKKKKKTEFGYWSMMMKFVFAVLFLSCITKLGFPVFTSRVMKTRLSPEIVRNLSQKALGFRDVEEKLGFLNRELQNILGANVLQASSKLPNWEVVQDGLMLRSRCKLYKSGMEEVSVWGWPLQTSGLLTTDFASRSFTILSGRVTEWSNGELSGSIRKANTSWEQGKWSVLVWRLDENTWILEYKRSYVFDNTRPFLSAIEFLKFNMLRLFEWMKQLWQFPKVNHLPPT